MLTLVGIRDRLRAENLYDTGRGPGDRPPTGNGNGDGDGDGAHHLTARTLDGTYNDLADPLMGSIGSRFGRNARSTASIPSRPRSSWSRTRVRSASSY
jgi:hypothetical protein